MLLQIVLISACGGAAYGIWSTGELLRGSLQGAYIGALISGLGGAYDLFLTDRQAVRALRRRYFALNLLVKTLYYFTVVVMALVSAQALFDLAFTGRLGALDAAFDRTTLTVTVVVIFLFNLFFEFDRLLGRQVLLSLITGRYNRPRLEQRAVLIIDLIGSTGLAEQLGALRFHALLSDFFFDLSEPVMAAKGDIHRYVGDGMIVTWPLQRALEDQRCLACVDAMRDRIARRAEHYQRRYGSLPAFRAALHCGEVVVGEMGDYRREIVMLGDVVNATARIEQECRALEAFALVSDDLVRRLPAQAGRRLRDAGEHHLRGRQEPLRLWILTPEGPA